MKKTIAITGIMMLFLGCGVSKELPTVEQVDIKKYAGIWYEIARLPNRFEKGLSCVTATYSLKKDGEIGVLNSGYLKKKDKNKTINGTAEIRDKAFPGRLKVTFFKPFYGDYYIIDLDDAYQYALVGSPSRDFLWVLSRKPKMEEQLYNRLLQKAKALDFPIEAMELIDQSCAL